jgi:hypothetical protein
MNERKATDADVQQVVRFFQYPSQEVSVIEATKKWSKADFLYALDRIDTDLSVQSEDIRDQLRGLYRRLRQERVEADARIAAEAASVQRHIEISRKLEELKKTHWSIVPNFWMTLLILIFTVIGVIVAIASFYR